MKTIIFPLLLVLSMMTSCGGSPESDAQKAADYYCQMKEADKANDSQKSSEMLRKMNDIRKNYMTSNDKEKSKQFDELFEKYKTEKKCQ